MRMWNVPTQLMCDKHLLGEHVEMHMFIGAFNKGTLITGYIADHLLDPSLIVARHDELVAEFAKRRFKHTSPIDTTIANNLAEFYSDVKPSIDIQGNINELAQRCTRCRRLISIARL